MPQSFIASYYHLVFSTKDRVPLINTEWESNLYAYIGGIARSNNALLLSAGGTADHIHLLTTLHKQQALTDFLRDIKSNSSRWVHQETGLDKFGWQAGYAAFSVSYSGLEDVTRYILNQKEHHRKMTYQEEVLRFLELNRIPYDERYIWD
jgi:putative transposase